MIIGEAPGAREDETHRAFVGPAGKLLDKLLKEARLSREDCYITNVAKCRPSGNQTPTKDEIKTCVANYLFDEIERVSPEFMLLLGNSALQGVVGRSGITNHRGSTFNVGGIQCLATFHPAAALRNPFREPELRADFHRLGRLVRDEESDVPTKVRIIRKTSQLKTLRKLLMQQEEIAFDLETYTFDNGLRLKGKSVVSGFQEWRGDDSVICCISFSWAPGETAVVPLFHERTPWKDPAAVLRFLKPALEQPDTRYIAQNGKFDCRWLAANKVFVNLTFDTMLAAHMLDENRAKGLKTLSEVILGVDAYDIGEDVRDAYHTPLKRLCVYAAKDAAYTLRLYHVFREQLREQPRTARIFKLMMMPASNMLTQVEQRGLWIDDERLETRLTEVEANVAKLKRHMLKYVPKAKHPQPVPPGSTKKLTKERAGINFNSPPQVGEWLFGDLGLTPLMETKSGANSTAESVLIQLAAEHEAPRALLKYRKWAKYADTYLLPIKYKHCDEKSHIHPTFKLFGTVTGRLSCVDPNLQNMPRNPFLRAIVGAPDGYSLIEADYSQIPLRVAAMLAHETNMLRVFHEGRDIHREVAVDLTGKLAEDVTSEERKMAKPVNFGFLYGMGWEKFITYARDNYEVNFTDEEAMAARETFFRKWPKLLAWHERQRRLVRRYGRVQSPIGRVRHLPDINSGDKKVRGEAERQAINSPVQSFASDLTLMAALCITRRLDPRVAHLCGLVHDANLFLGRADRLDEILPVIHEEMMNPPLMQWFGTELRVPIDVEIKVGKYWSEGEVWTP